MPKCCVAYGDYLSLLVAITQMSIIVFGLIRVTLETGAFYAFIGSIGLKHDATFRNNSSRSAIMK